MPSKKKSDRPRPPRQEDAPARRFPRVPSRNSVVVRKLGAGEEGGLTTTEVVGLGGCSFLHAEPLEAGETLYLSILIGVELAEARVRVVYSKPREEGGFEIGVEFTEVPQRDLALIRGVVGSGGEGFR
ncbi:MAG: PilZ domain-containing protein [Acidobacteriota bacterium]